MPKQQTTDGFHVMRAFMKRVQEWDCHCPYLWRLCLSFIQNQNIQICDNEWEFVFSRLHILNVEKLGVWSLNPDPYMYYVMSLSIELNSYKLFLRFIFMKVFLAYKICVFIQFFTFILFFLSTYYLTEHTF